MTVWKNVLQIDVSANPKMYCTTWDATVAKTSLINNVGNNVTIYNNKNKCVMCVSII